MTFDILLRGGLVFDGLGSEPVRADVAVLNDEIVAIGALSHLPASRILDVSPYAVAPGFIDIHTHSDFSLLFNRPMRSTLAQGVTTELVGNCGVSVGLIDGKNAHFAQEKRWAERDGQSANWESMAEYLTRVEDGGIAANVATLAGHGSLRKAVMGYEKRAPTDKELTQMQQLLARAMEDGAVGFSTGLEYLPGGYAELDEQIALARIAADAGGFYATHLRNEADTLVESVTEALTVAEKAQIALQLSHHKAEGRANWGKVQTTLGMMADARKSGMDVLTDQYPYTAFMTGLGVILLPAWANDGSPGEVAARLRQPESRTRVLEAIAAEHWDWNTLQIGIARQNPEKQGKTLAELGKLEAKTPADAALDLIIAEDGWVSAVHFAMCEEDIEAVLRDEHTMIGSDGVSNDPHGLTAADKTHPRSYGTFPRVLGRYVREREILTLAQAVRRMSRLPAQRLKLTDRGTLEVGKKADITIFDPNLIRDTATFDDPHQYPTGIAHVLVNGRLAWTNGAQTDALAGKILRRAG